MTLELWSETLGEKPNRVTVFERADKGMVVYLRWYVAGKPKHERAEVGTLRDSRGRIMKRRQDQARAEAFSKIEELEGKRRPKKAAKGPLSLRAGVELAFSDRGCYPLDPKSDSWTGDARRYIENAVRLLGGDEVLWESVTPGMVRSVWRQMEKAGEGHDKATKTLVVFFAIARWLEGEFQEQRFPRPPKGWRQELKEHWHKRGHETKPSRPRHTPEEIALLFQHRSEADPRVALALALGAELRGGQVTRARRSHCDLSGERWRLEIPSRSLKKRVPPVVLNRLERAALEEAITTGYLSTAEAAFRAGVVKDYALFPAGRLRQGKAIPERCQESIHPTTLAALFHELEEKAGVTPQPGRAWHGLRRGFSDFYARLIKEGKIKDPRLADQLQGWVIGSAMRERVYQEQESEEMLSDAADARLLRPGFDAEQEG